MKARPRQLATSPLAMPLRHISILGQALRAWPIEPDSGSRAGWPGRGIGILSLCTLSGVSPGVRSSFAHVAVIVLANLC
jgi:hypothetical protein